MVLSYFLVVIATIGMLQEDFNGNTLQQRPNACINEQYVCYSIIVNVSSSSVSKINRYKFCFNNALYGTPPK